MGLIGRHKIHKSIKESIFNAKDNETYGKQWSLHHMKALEEFAQTCVWEWQIETGWWQWREDRICLP